MSRWRDRLAVALATVILGTTLVSAQPFRSGPGLTVISGGGTTYTGTANQVIVAGTVLSTPQDIATTSTPQFGGLGIGVAGAANKLMMPSGGIIDFNGANMTVTHGAGFLRVNSFHGIDSGIGTIVQDTFLYCFDAGTAVTGSSRTAGSVCIKRQGTSTLGIYQADYTTLGYLMAGYAQVGGTTALTLTAGAFGMSKITASGSAPGASGAKLELVCGTNAGTAKLTISAGTSATPATVLDNIGGGVTGC